MTELNVLNAKTCEFDWKVKALEIAAWVDEMIQRGACDHVRKAELLPRDGILCAIFDAPCFDVERNRTRCIKREHQKLYLMALRFVSPHKVTLKVTISLEVIPADSLQVEGARESHGTQRLELGAFSLHPLQHGWPAWNQEWRYSGQISCVRREKPTAASICVYFGAKREGARATASSVDLAVIIPPLSEKEEVLPTDLTAVVITESLKLLIKDGWEFLKSHVLKSSDSGTDLVQLNIDGAGINSENASDQEITVAVRNSNLPVSRADLEELDGLNRRVQALLIRRKHLLADVERTTTGTDHAKTSAEIELINLDISDLQRKIWSILQHTGRISAVQRGSE